MNQNPQKLTNAIIEIDEVEYLITPVAVSQIEKAYDLITLRRLIDSEDVVFSLRDVKKAVSAGIIDHL